MPDRKGGPDTAAKVSDALRRMREAGAPRPDPAAGPQTGAGAGADSGTIGARVEKSAGAFAALEAAVRKSRSAFVDRLAQYRETLDAVELDLADSRRTDASLELALRIAHRIAGVGRTFGFADLGDVARATETAISAYRDARGSGELRAASIARIDELAGMIEEICSDDDTCPA